MVQSVQPLSLTLVFDRRGRLRVRETPEGMLEPMDRDTGEGQVLATVSVDGAETEVRAELAEVVGGGEFISWEDLEGRIENDPTSVSESLKALVGELEPHLVRVPYLDLGENEYIYRFRTAKERNRNVYIDRQSEALYQSALCGAIKEARRTKEKTSGEPAVLDFGAVRYVIPSHFGFCLGVQNAIERAYETVAANPGKRVFMLSELIHNPYVNEDLLARGLRYLQTDKGMPLREDGKVASDPHDPAALWNQLKSDDLVIIPAFGATNEDKLRLIKKGLSIRENDATCMLVEKVWKAARRYAEEGFTVLIHGKSEHEETKATFSNASSHGPALMLRNMEHAERLGEVILADGDERRRLFERSFAGLYSNGFDPERDLDKLAVVNQTTLLRNETLRIIDYLRGIVEQKFGVEKAEQHIWSKGKGDTLCYATQVNQDALHKAVQEPVDAALVVGGRNSSNTYQLYRVCRERFGDKAHYIQSERNILSVDRIRHYVFPAAGAERADRTEIVRPFLDPSRKEPQRILLTGGASCPDGIIQQVIHRINGFFPDEALHPLETVVEGFRGDT